MVMLSAYIALAGPVQVANIIKTFKKVSSFLILKLRQCKEVLKQSIYYAQTPYFITYLIPAKHGDSVQYPLEGCKFLHENISKSLRSPS